jgi:prepilin-type N-terminal cleavage/methylation domain-containing protein
MKRAFTLVEIMIVVGIVAVLTMLSAPNILRARINANEGTALANLKTITGACQIYYIDKDTYPDSLIELTQATPPYIDSILAGGSKQGYEFIYHLNTSGFAINANPTGLLKGRYFYVDQTDVVRARSGEEAGPDDGIVK